jgi:hypothetical protein
LRAAGAEKVFRETASGAKTDRGAVTALAASLSALIFIGGEKKGG